MNIDLKKFLKEDLKLSHQSRTNKLQIYVNGERIICKNSKELAGTIASKLPQFKNNSNWQQFKVFELSELGNDAERFIDALPEILEEHITTIMSEKTHISDNLHGNVEASAFNSFVKELYELPKNGFNAVDKAILSNIRYCRDDTCIYVKVKDQLKLIGKLESLKKDPTQNKLCQWIQWALGTHYNEGTPMKISEYIEKCLKDMTELRHTLITETKKSMDGGLAFEDVKVDLGDDGIFIPSEKSYKDDMNALENAANNFCVEKLWTLVPCSLFTARVITLKAVFNTYEIQKDNGPNIKINDFVKYIYDVVRSGEALTEAAYLKNIFTVYAAELKDGAAFRLNEVPRTYGDGDIYALYKYNEKKLNEELKDIDCYEDVDDCSNLTLLRKWMNEDEYRLTMAWAYAAVHPITVKSNIALLLWTGGGTGKSSIVAMIKYALMMASGGHEEDLYFEIKGDKFLDDDKNWQPDGRVGLPKAALVNIDEATTECIETYKNFSGSADKNILALRLNYENTINYDVKGKFIFTTNKGLQLSSDDGSLLRRVALIKHTDVQNILGDKPKTNEEIVLEYKKQIPVMLKEGEKAIEEIKQMGYSSIDAYAMQCPNINKNLQESTSTSANTETYSEIWTLLTTYLPDLQQKDGSYRMRGKLLKLFYNYICGENGEDPRWFSNFKKFILEHPTLFVKENKKGHFYGYLKGDITELPSTISSLSDYIGIDKNPTGSNSIYCLYALKTDKKS